MTYKNVIIAIIFIAVVYSLVVSAKTAYYIYIGRAQATQTKSFQQHKSDASLKILIMGDSSAVGVGASSNSDSVAGLIADDYPNVDIKNLAVNGMRTAGLVTAFDEVAGQHYDLVVIHIGGNDIVRFVDINESVANLKQALVKSAAVGENTVLLTAGNMESAKMFPWPVRKIYGARSRLYREKFMYVANEMGIQYVDLYRTKDNDPYFENPKKYYSRDLFHPSSDGYAVWYERIGPVINKILN